MNHGGKVALVAMLQRGLDFTPILTQRCRAREFEQGLAAMLSGQSGQVILDWEAGSTP